MASQPNRCMHICVDMQNMFAEETPWKVAWFSRVLPGIVRLAAASREHTIFTRFIPAKKPGDGQGAWKDYYERWASMTLERMPPRMIELVPELGRFAPPAEIIDKKTYSPWLSEALAETLQRRGADTLVVTGGETDVCVLATVLGAVDRGYHVRLVRDCLCSSSDKTHDALMTLYSERYGQQVDVVDAEAAAAIWR